MQLPLADLAVIDVAKVHHYLLSPTHPVGRHKARYFATLGYRASTAGLFVRDLRSLARRGDAVEQSATPYGTKYRVGGMLRGPAGMSAWIETIWIIRPGDPRPHLVTAYPGVKP